MGELSRLDGCMLRWAVAVLAYVGIIITLCIMAVAALVAAPSAAIICIGAKALDALSSDED
jgi:hypothetical protein